MVKVIRRFFDFCGETNRKKFVTSIWLGVLIALFEALKIPAIAVMMRALLPVELGGNGGVTTNDILLSLGIMLLSILGSGLAKAKATMLQTEAGYDTCAMKRIEIAEHMRYLPMGWFNENSLGQITSVTTNVMENLENVATRVVMMVAQGLLTTLLIIAMLAIFDWRVALVLLVGFGVFLLMNGSLQTAAGKLAGRKIAADEKLVEKVLEYLQGMAEVKAYHLTGQKSGELNAAIAENVEMTLIPRMTAQTFIAKLTGVAMTALSCALFVAGKMDALTAILMVISSFIVYASLETAGNYSALLRVVDMSVDRAQEILEAPQMDISGEEIQPASRDIAAKEVVFSYDKKKVIDGVSLNIPERTTTAIVGPSGGGKTTLVNLLARFWDADSGSVTLGGRDVRDYDMDSLMKNFSFVFQNVYLFHDTIANNIRFGSPDAPMEDVIAAAKNACCHDFITALPEGYETVIGEGGTNLSGGERQRISIARAMMKDAPVIFLDEATANVDPENENELTKAIEALTKEKTVIMIAHRLKTVEHADQILVVDHGKIVQRGAHEQLMAQEGIYKTFVGERREAASWKVKV